MDSGWLVTFHQRIKPPKLLFALGEVVTSFAQTTWMKTHWHTKALLDLSILISPISMNFMKRTHLSSKHAHGPWSLSLTQCIPPRSWPTTRTDLRKHGPEIPTFGRQIPGRLAMPDQIDRRGMSYTCRRWQGRKCTSMPVITWLEPSLSQEVRVLFIKMLTKSFETFCIFPWALHSSPPSENIWFTLRSSKSLEFF